MEHKVGWRIGKMLDNRYEIQSVLGIGGMAVVYKAFDNKLKRHVAIKVLRDDVAMDQQSRARFRTEYQAVGMLSHPNIRAVYDVVSSGDTEYIVMEYVEGINLKQYLKKKGSLSWKETLHFSTQIAKALSQAHSKGIIHMDIKPQNIILPKDGTAKIADFGIARLDGSSKGSEDGDEAVGSIHYISPEQARGEALDERTDIYSLGVVMYEMLTGRLPYDGESVAEVAVKHFTVPPEAPTSIDPDIPPELEEITLRAMQPNRDDRYRSADEMLADLEDFRKGQTAVISAAVRQELAKQTERRPVIRDEIHVISKNVPRISRAGELSKEGYARRRVRANTVSTLLGFAIVICVAVGLFIFVWNYWLAGIFADAERVTVPDFTGELASDITDREDMAELFNFKIIYSPDSKNSAGIIIGQDPAGGSSRMVVPEGIQVELTVSSGIQLVTIPNVINQSSAVARSELQNMGLNVEVLLEPSDAFTSDYVMKMTPDVGTNVSSGSTVTLTVSAGPSVVYTYVPDVVGMSKAAALLELQQSGLICSETEITYISSSAEDEGFVLWQNYEPATQVVADSKVYLQVGSGPAANTAQGE